MTENIPVDGLKKVTVMNMVTLKNGKQVPAGVRPVEYEQVPVKVTKEAGDRVKAVASSIVTTTSGKAFDANPEARLNIVTAIQAGIWSTVTELNWKLADGSVSVVTLNELQEANYLALVNFGTIVSVS